MAKEVERKFLVNETSFLNTCSEKIHIKQAYFVGEKSMAIRVRTSAKEDGSSPEAFVTFKLNGDGMSTDEFEYNIPYNDALEMMKSCGRPVMEKTRHLVKHDGRVWEVDVFHGKLSGLVVAEIEGDDVGNLNKFPQWVGKEVTFDSYYKNANLSRIS